MKLSISQRLYFGLAFGFIIVITIGILSYLSYQKQIQQSNWVQHSQEVINTITSVKQLISQIESSKRNAITNPTPQAKMTFDTTIIQLRNTLNALELLVQDNPAAQIELGDIKDSTNNFIDQWRAINPPKNFDPNNDTVLLLQRIRAGSDHTNTLVTQLEEFRQSERNLFVNRSKMADRWASQSIATLIVGLILILVIVGVLSYQVFRELRGRLKTQQKLRRSLQEMENLNAETTQQNWKLSSLSAVNNLLQQKHYADASTLATSCTATIAKLLDAPAAIMYSFHDDGQFLQPIGTYATPSNIPIVHSLGKGITGQAALSKEATIIDDLPETFYEIETGLGIARATSLVLLPLWVDDQLIGLLEVVGFKPFAPMQVQLINLLSHNMASALQSVISRKQLEELINQISKQKEELETSQDAIKAQTSALERSNQYKSQFLANMSHELRTPLNSILILANLLWEDRDGRLTDKQKEYSHIIHKSGSDLLHLINDILDLSKIESGKIDFLLEEVSVAQICTNIHDLFAHEAEEKHIVFSTEGALKSLLSLLTDQKRVEQILKNLVSNAVKFTPSGGSVTLDASMDINSEQIIFVVKDTGRGIPKEYQSVIFEAFQQVDGDTNRKYGGTGLGLSISRHLAEQLGGSLTLISSVGIGSEFTLTLPKVGIAHQIQSLQDKQMAEMPNSLPTATVIKQQDSIPDDRHTEGSSELPLLLVIEDDRNFALILRDFVRSKNYRVIVALTGEEGLYCARRYKPNAVLLDIHLPGLSGTEIIYTLKRTPNLSSIPIHVITSHDDLGYLNNEITSITLKPFQMEELDMIFQSISLDNLNGFSNQEYFKSEANDDKQENLSTGSLPPTTSSAELGNIDDENSIYIDFSNPKAQHLDGYTILLTDDDMRNVYALTAMLESIGADVHAACNGQEALEILSKNTNIQIVLMDIMMPIMDGYETMAKIRLNESYSHIPIIAVSAKALQGDRQKAIDAGATDYLTKPINTAQLVALIIKCLQSTKD